MSHSVKTEVGKFFYYIGENFHVVYCVKHDERLEESLWEGRDYDLPCDCEVNN